MMTVVTGGAASGKSEYAEGLILTAQAVPRIYVATMISRSPEDEARVARHRDLRANKGFLTVERPWDLAGWDCPNGAAVLVECMTNLLANELYEFGAAGKNVPAAILRGLTGVTAHARMVVVVTGEVFSDGCSYHPSTMEYLASLGAVNRRMAAMADRVIEVVCGIPIPIKEAYL